METKVEGKECDPIHVSAEEVEPLEGMFWLTVDKGVSGHFDFPGVLRWTDGVVLLFHLERREGRYCSVRQAVQTFKPVGKSGFQPAIQQGDVPRRRTQRRRAQMKGR